MIIVCRWPIVSIPYCLVLLSFVRACVCLRCVIMMCPPALLLYRRRIVPSFPDGAISFLSISIFISLYGGCRIEK